MTWAKAKKCPQLSFTFVSSESVECTGCFDEVDGQADLFQDANANTWLRVGFDSNLGAVYVPVPELIAYIRKHRSELLK